mgnify:CR=1 FL=1
MSGASILQIARRITLKLAWPAALASLLILFVRSLEIVRGAGAAGPPGRHPGLYLVDLPGDPPVSEPDRACRRLRDHAAPDHLGSASTCQSRLAYPGLAKFSTVTGKGFRPRTIDLGRWRYFTAALFILYFVVIVLLPFLVLVWSSLQKFYSAPSWAALEPRSSLDSYRAVLDYPQFWSTVRNSLFLALTHRDQ